MSDLRIPQVKRVPAASLKNLNTFGIEAQALELITLSTVDQLDSLHTLLTKDPRLIQGQPLHVLGGGSNLLIGNNIDSLVLKIELTGIECIAQNGNQRLVKAAAGEPWHAFVRTCLDRGWNGLENLSLIPGTVGASPIQNIGAYGIELKDRFESLSAWNWRTNEVKIWGLSDCAFSYRNSAFKRADGNDWIILSVNFLLTTETAVNTEYGDLKTELLHNKIDPNGASAVQVSDAVCAVRQRKLPDPKQLGNAGSFFQNPIVGNVQAQQLKEQHPAMPQWPNPDGNTKISAAWLIDQSGWKGYRKGDAGVHQHHALVLVNYGAATGQQLTELAYTISASVYAKFDVQIYPEPITWPLDK